MKTTELMRLMVVFAVFAAGVAAIMSDPTSEEIKYLRAQNQAMIDSQIALLCK